MKSNALNRREFLGRSFGMAGAAGLLAHSALPSLLRAQAQAPANSTAIRRPDRFEDSFIFERKPFTWPGGKTLAVWFVPNIEVWHFDSSAGAAASPVPTDRVPDVINYGWREYGIRVGLWRIADIFDSAGVRATVALNAAVCEVYPKAVEEMKRRGWEFMGHGITNTRTLANLPIEDEREVVRTTLRTIERASGQRPRGWLGPGLAETFNTLDLLAEEGVVYVGDWNSDDQPFRMKVKTGKMYSVPYGTDINDMSLILRHAYTGEQYVQALKDQFDTLYAESQKTARVMGIPLHPFLMGQPWRAPYLREAIAYFQKHDRVWFATGSEIVDAYERVRL
jgi:peptidoglycan/xylan/chitin deacetylase (PgdA/CDA1 family)